MPSEVSEKELTPEEMLRGRLRFNTRQYRIAVRWLRDARGYYRQYSSELTYDGKNWKDNAEGELAKDAQKAYTEAIASVLRWRRLITECNESLMDLAKEKIDAKKRTRR